MNQADKSRYTATAIALHWLMALVILTTFVVGLCMVDLPASPSRMRLINWHKWAGITILMLSVLRLLWRLTHRPPVDVPMPAWQKAVARLSHGGLYALFFAVPLVGWLYSSAAGRPVVWLGVLRLPDLIAADKVAAASIKPWHGALAWTLALLAALHVAAALKHQLIDRDGLLYRMLPRTPKTVDSEMMFSGQPLSDLAHVETPE